MFSGQMSWTLAYEGNAFLGNVGIHSDSHFSRPESSPKARENLRSRDCT